jgi:hypothetical protein
MPNANLLQVFGVATVDSNNHLEISCKAGNLMVEYCLFIGGDRYVVEITQDLLDHDGKIDCWWSAFVNDECVDVGYTCLSDAMVGVQKFIERERKKEAEAELAGHPDPRGDEPHVVDPNRPKTKKEHMVIADAHPDQSKRYAFGEFIKDFFFHDHNEAPDVTWADMMTYPEFIEYCKQQEAGAEDDGPYGRLT